MLVLKKSATIEGMTITVASLTVGQFKKFQAAMKAAEKANDR